MTDPLAPHSLSPTELKQLLAAERDGEPFFAFRDHDERLALFRAGRSGATFTVGRRAEMDLPLAWDNEVSGLHAELQGIGGEWTVVDDGLSTNGTFVNGQRVGGRQRLRDGDRVRIGRTIVVFRAGQAAAVPPTVAAREGPAAPDLTAMQRKVLIALCRPYRDGDSWASPGDQPPDRRRALPQRGGGEDAPAHAVRQVRAGRPPAEREARAARRVRAAVRRGLTPRARLIGSLTTVGVTAARSRRRRARSRGRARRERRTPSASAQARASSTALR